MIYGGSARSLSGWTRQTKKAPPPRWMWRVSKVVLLITLDWVYHHLQGKLLCTSWETTIGDQSFEGSCDTTGERLRRVSIKFGKKGISSVSNWKDKSEKGWKWRGKTKCLDDLCRVCTVSGASTKWANEGLPQAAKVKNNQMGRIWPSNDDRLSQHYRIRNLWKVQNILSSWNTE